MIARRIEWFCIGCLALLGAALLNLAAAQEASRSFSLGEARETIAVKAGDRFTLKLKAHFGAGLSWSLRGKPAAALRLIGKSVEETGNGREGRFSLQVFEFSAEATGEGVLVFDYRRPWLRGERPERTIVCSVRVTER